MPNVCVSGEKRPFFSFVLNIQSMKLFYLLLPLVILSIGSNGQQSESSNTSHFPKHFISVNPLNCLVFQQIGLTYEYKMDRIGVGGTVGYLYPNHKEYSNFFLAGPTGYASFGDYSGFFIIPQVNFYFKDPKCVDYASLFYITIKPVYRFMRIDSTQWTRWIQIDDGVYDSRKMIDNTHVYGGFFDLGYKMYAYHLFIDFNFGAGGLFVAHDMLISRRVVSNSSSNNAPGYHPAIQDYYSTFHCTVNFTITIGGAF